MTNEKAFLPGSIQLPSGVTARIALDPMPQPDAAGRYHVSAARNTVVSVSLYRGEKLIEHCPWNSLITEAGTATLRDGTVLDRDDIDALGEQGWAAMHRVGKVPGVFIG